MDAETVKSSDYFAWKPVRAHVVLALGSHYKFTGQPTQAHLNLIWFAQAHSTGRCLRKPRPAKLLKEIHCYLGSRLLMRNSGWGLLARLVIYIYVCVDIVVKCQQGPVLNKKRLPLHLLRGEVPRLILGCVDVLKLCELLAEYFFLAIVP